MTLAGMLERAAAKLERAAAKFRDLERLGAARRRALRLENDEGVEELVLAVLELADEWERRAKECDDEPASREYDDEEGDTLAGMEAVTLRSCAKELRAALQGATTE
jgi:hypothetical protein